MAAASGARMAGRDRRAADGCCLGRPDGGASPTTCPLRGWRRPRGGHNRHLRPAIGHAKVDPAQRPGNSGPRWVIFAEDDPRSGRVGRGAGRRVGSGVRYAHQAGRPDGYIPRNTVFVATLTGIRRTRWSPYLETDKFTEQVAPTDSQTNETRPGQRRPGQRRPGQRRPGHTAGTATPPPAILRRRRGLVV